MAKIIKKDVIQRGNVTTVYKNMGNTPTASIKDLKQRPINVPTILRRESLSAV